MMDVTLTIGAWIVPALLTIALLWWMFSRDYSGDYNFNGLFYAPVTGMGISFVWMLYFGIGWALS